MKKLWMLIYRNGFMVICFLFAIVYLYINFTTIKEAVLFLACIFLIYYSSVFFNSFFKKIFIERESIFLSVRHYWVNILLLLAAVVLIYFFGSLKLLNAILLGISIFVILFGVYYFFKSRHIR